MSFLRAADNLCVPKTRFGARVEAAAQPGEVLVTRTVKDLVAGSGIAFADRGTHILKGVSGDWQLHAVTG